jgi:phosphatidylglycerophosphatase A
LTTNHTATTDNNDTAQYLPLNAVQKWLTRIFATTFGFSYSPIAPGTAGTLPPLALYILYPIERGWMFLGIATIIFLVGVPLASWAERLWQRKDPGHVSIDEVAGFMVSIAFVPAQDPILLAVAGFFVFRVFDIVKPPPGRRSEYLPHGWGVMTDDVIAGIYANAFLQVTFRMFGL